MRGNSTRERISRLSGLAVLCAISLTLGFHVLSVQAAPFVYVTSSPPGSGSQILRDTVKVIDTATSTVVASISIDGVAKGLAVTADGKRAYVTITQGFSTGSVSVLDAATNTVVTTVTVGDFCIGGIAISPDGKTRLCG